MTATHADATTNTPLGVLVVTAERSREVTAPLAHADCDATAVEIDGSAGFFSRNLATVRRTWRAIRRHDPDVVLLDASELIGCLAALVAVLSGVPVVYRFKGDNRRTLLDRRDPGRDGLASRLRVALSLAVNRVTYALASGYVVVSRDLKDVVVDRLDCDPNLVRVVHVPVDPDRFESVDPPQVAVADGDRERDSDALERRDGNTRGTRDGDAPEISEGTVVLTVTNLRYRGKLAGVETAVEGMAPILADRDDVAYVVAGGGRYHERLLATIDRTVTDPSVRERVYAPGFVDDIDALYARADVVVYVSHIDGYPNVVLEAQLAELPVVANDAHGMAEQITHRRTGYLLGEATADSVTRWVEHALENPAERAQVGTEARQRVLTENDPAEVGRRLETALGEILAAASKGTQ